MLNLQGDVERIYDATGEIVVTYFYDAWGKLISIEDDTTNNIGTKNPLRYRGYYYDTETGFYYLQSRYYDPEICRFINADSLLIAGNDYIQGTNRYAYCINNPIVFADRNGYAYDYVLGTFDSGTEELFAAIGALATVCGAANYIMEYGMGLGYSESAITESLEDFLLRTKPLYDDIFDLASIMLIGVKVMDGSAWWLNMSSTIGTADDLVSILKSEFPSLLSTNGNLLSIIASVGTEFVIDYLNPLINNTELVSYLGKHLLVAVGDFGISYMALSIGAGVATAFNPLLGAAMGTVLLLGGSEAWSELTKDI
ncbi:MAG: RHS repeat-associated core domain-containing protein [Clostridia bacterium]|nr:RHS repeat-associated core domain-containing protein [Clostridia bacterium]